MQLRRQKFRQANQINAGNSGSVANEIVQFGGIYANKFAVTVLCGIACKKEVLLMGVRLIFHVDVNSAFLSWEATRRVKNGEADLRLLPSAIGGDRESRRGVILAKSIPAKAYGIQTGEPIAHALRKCPSLYLAKPDFHLYHLIMM